MATTKYKIMLAGAVLLFLLEVGCADRRGPAQEDTSNLLINYYALHDSSSRQYRSDCLTCHSDVLTEDSLSPSVPHAHSAMISQTPGSTTEGKCVYCHTNTDLLQHSAGNIRRNVAVQTCDLCHGPSGPSTKQYYQK